MNHEPNSLKQKDTQEAKWLGLFYKSAITLAFLSLTLSSAYLFYYLYRSPDPGDITNPLTMASFNADRRMALISTAFFVALSFGFLGFALFLIDAKGEAEGEMSVADHKLKFARLSPGLFVILCSTVIIVVCANFKISYSTDFKDGTSETSTDEWGRGDSLKVTSGDDDLSSEEILSDKKTEKQPPLSK